jgi:hypothetical protein
VALPRLGQVGDRRPAVARLAMTCGNGGGTHAVWDCRECGDAFVIPGGADLTAGGTAAMIMTSENADNRMIAAGGQASLATNRVVNRRHSGRKTSEVPQTIR